MVAPPPPTVALGSASWGAPYGVANPAGPPDDAALEGLLRAAHEAGLDTIDTARAYGVAEERIGALLERLPGPWRVVTKLHPGVYSEGDSAREVLARTRESLQRSLEALRRERLDVLLLHRAFQRTCCHGAIWERLLEERAAGRIGRVGVSVARPEEAPPLLEDPSVEVIQVAASLLDRRLVRDGFFERAVESGREVHVRSVFLQGAVFLDVHALPAHLTALGPVLDRVRDFAAAAGRSRSWPFLAYAAGLPVRALVLGCDGPAQLLQHLKELGRPLSAEEAEALEGLVPTLPADVLDPARWPG